jgi:hypothetical protein
MMRIVVAISVTALVCACAHQDPSKTLTKAEEKRLASGTVAAIPESTDSTFYIGYVDYFPDTREFYTNVYYRKNREYPDEEFLESRLDSVIVSQDDWDRERLPIEEARKVLVLSGLDTLFIYDRSHTLVSTARFRRVEYLWNGMESFFIAVFEPDAGFTGQTGELYGISASYTSLGVPVSVAGEFEDRKLNDQLMTKMKLDRALHWEMRHFRTGARGKILSIVSSYAIESNEGQSYLTSSSGNEVHILNEEVNNFHYLNILPLPIAVNGAPLLLISAGYPSSDVLWDYLAGFDGSTYQAIEYNRIDPTMVTIK